MNNNTDEGLIELLNEIIEYGVPSDMYEGSHQQKLEREIDRLKEEIEGFRGDFGYRTYNDSKFMSVWGEDET